MDNKITQAQFTKGVGKRSLHTDKVVREVLLAAASEILAFTKNGVSVQFMGIGKFVPHDAPERMGRNPKTGDEFKIPAKRVLKFKVSSAVDLSK